MISQRTPALALALTVVIVAVAGCAQQVCNLVGCTDGLAITVADFDPGDRFDVVVDGDVDGSFGCVRNGDGYDVAEVTGAIADSSPRCLVDGVALSGAPSTVTVTVTSGDETRTKTFAEIAYDELQPNGPDCEPTCRTATVTLD